MKITFIRFMIWSCMESLVLTLEQSNYCGEFRLVYLFCSGSGISCRPSDQHPWEQRLSTKAYKERQYISQWGQPTGLTISFVLFSFV